MAVFLGAIAVDVARYTGRSHLPIPFAKKLLIYLAPVAELAIAVPAFFIERTRISQFRIEEDVLVLGRKRDPLEGLTAVAPDPQILKGAFRRRRNGGPGAIRGSFQSKREGRFEAFLTDTEHAVILRWPDRAVAVSAADTEFFIMMARHSAGLR